MDNHFEQFRALRFQDGICCTFCGGRSWGFHSSRPSGVRRYKCASCGRIFSDVSGTFLESSKVRFSKWCEAAALFLRERGASPKELERAVNVSYPTALKMARFFNRLMRARELREKCGNNGAQAVDLDTKFGEVLFDVGASD